MKSNIFAGICTILLILYVLGGVGFAVLPGTVVDLVNSMGRGLFCLKPSPAPQGAFYSVLAAGMMATISTCMALVLKDTKRNRPFLLPVFVEKCTSSGLGLVYCLFGEPNSGYLALFVVDFPLALLTLYLYRVKVLDD